MLLSKAVVLLLFLRSLSLIAFFITQKNVDSTPRSFSGSRNRGHQNAKVTNEEELLCWISNKLQSIHHRPFFLPFRVFRLMVINDSGLPIYKYVWHELSSKEKDDEDLIPAMFSGMGILMKNTINQGLIQEIHLEHAKLLFTYSKQYKLHYIIVVSQSSASLRQGLELFQDQFEQNFRDRLNDVVEFAQFVSADNIVTDVFNFVP